MKLYVKFATGSFEQLVQNEEHAHNLMQSLTSYGKILEYKITRVS